MAQPANLRETLTTVDLPWAEVILEGGSESSAALINVMTRLIDELAAGQVLEVISQVAGVSLDLGEWCHRAGHDVLRELVDGDQIRLWIRRQ